MSNMWATIFGDGSRDNLTEYHLVLSETRAYFKGKHMSKADWVSLVVAALICAVGLATDSSVCTVASMLISPLMSPLLQVAYALSDSEVKVRTRSIKAFVLGIAACLLLGFLWGLLSHVFGVDVDYKWPTQEMESRSQTKALLPGLVVASLSGIGVANAVQPAPTKTGGIRTNDVIGVAISASLLPPLVNSGMILAYGWCSTSLSESQAFNRALVSFSLTALNVICIIVSATVMFKYRLVQLEKLAEANQPLMDDSSPEA